MHKNHGYVLAAGAFHPSQHFAYTPLRQAEPFLTLLKTIEGVGKVDFGPIVHNRESPVDPVMVEEFHQEPPYYVKVRYFAPTVSQHIIIHCPQQRFMDVSRLVLDYCETSGFFRSMGRRNRR